MAADIVGLADNTFGNNLIQRARVVFDKQPVADLHTVAVNGQRFAVERVQNHQRNEFFREMVRAVVVGAVGYNGRQTVSTQPCADEVVAGRFRSRVGAGRCVWRGLSKQIVCAVQIAIDFIGRNMVEAEGFALFRRHLLPVGAGCFKQIECADDIGLDKLACRIDRAVDMTFRSQVHHGIRLVLCEYAVEFGAVANIHLLKSIARIIGYLGQRFQIAGISQLIDIDDRVLGVLDNMTDNGRTDKARAAGNKDFFHKFQRIAKKYERIIADRMCVFQIKRPSENISFRRPVSGQLNRRSHLGCC